jgi:uncharacterized membrane protein
LTVVFSFIVLRSGARKSDYLKKKERLYISAMLFILFIIVNLGIFIIWSRPSYPAIEGLQSRYLIPLTIPLVLCLLPIYKKIQNVPKFFYVICIASVIFVQSSAAIYTLKIY